MNQIVLMGVIVFLSYSYYFLCSYFYKKKFIILFLKFYERNDISIIAKIKVSLIKFCKGDYARKKKLLDFPHKALKIIKTNGYISIENQKKKKKKPQWARLKILSCFCVF